MKTLTPTPLVACTLLLLVLSACGDEVDQGSNNTSDSEFSTATTVASPSPSPTPSSEATPTSDLQFPTDTYPLTGTIVEVEVEVGVDSDADLIHIVEHPDDPYAGEQYYVRVRDDTRIAAWTSSGAEPRQYADLEVGMRVVVANDGAIAESYPAWAGGSHIFIMRSEGSDSLNPDVVVTVTFVHSLFSGFTPDNPPFSDDAFYVSYTVAGDAHGRLDFCGGDTPASPRCEGYGATYEATVNVPRGAELEYSVYRVRGAGSADEELVEQGQEIIDADWETRSHYRYGAKNPGGYD